MEARPCSPIALGRRFLATLTHGGCCQAEGGGDALLPAHRPAPLWSLPRTLLKNSPPNLYERIRLITDSLEEMLQSSPGPCGEPFLPPYPSAKGGPGGWRTLGTITA